MLRTRLVALLLSAALTGCAATKTRFYLVPDPTGHVGEVTVSNAAGSVTLNEARESAEVARRSKAPSTPQRAADGEIERTFAAALAAMPAPPQTFVLYFATASSALDGAATGVLDKIVGEIDERDSRDVSVNGHTDLVGDDASNMQLSHDRANVVRDALVNRGVPAESLSIEFYGKTHPRVPTPDDVSEPTNRRVEVVVR